MTEGANFYYNIYMENNYLHKYGGEILKSITKAAESGDFSNLSKDIKEFINGAGDAFKNNLFNSSDSSEKNYKDKENFQNTEYNNEDSFYYKSPFDIGKTIKDSANKSFVKGWQNKELVKSPYFSCQVKKSRGKGKIALGILFLFNSIPIILGNLNDISWYINNNTSPFTKVMIIPAILLFSGIGLVIAGSRNQKLLKDYFNFGKITGTREYVTIKELSDRSGLIERKVVNQIKKMKKINYFNFAAIDDKKSTLMLTNNIYEEYVKSSAFRQEKDSTKEEIAKTKKASSKSNNKTTYYKIDENLPKDVRGILEEGNDYLNKIHNYNDLIPDSEKMSDKLYTLEATVLSIFKKLQEEPEAAGDLRKFMSYYLPTTEKLLQSYVNLSKETDNLENVANSKKEIEEATDLINEAFVQLLNQLFQNTAWDISSDISVMKTMMKQDALI